MPNTAAGSCGGSCGLLTDDAGCGCGGAASGSSANATGQSSDQIEEPVEHSSAEVQCVDRNAFVDTMKEVCEGQRSVAVEEARSRSR